MMGYKHLASAHLAMFLTITSGCDSRI